MSEVPNAGHGAAALGVEFGDPKYADQWEAATIELARRRGLDFDALSGAERHALRAETREIGARVIPDMIPVMERLAEDVERLVRAHIAEEIQHEGLAAQRSGNAARYEALVWAYGVALGEGSGPSPG